MTREPYNGLPPFQGHSETSESAALLAQESAPTKRARVYRYLVEQGWGGATDEEIQLALRMDANTERPRRCELLEKRLIMDSRRTRMTRSGRAATVWVAIPQR